MTIAVNFKELVRQTLVEPRAAARHLLVMPIPPQGLWLSLALMSVLNAIVYSLALHLSTPADPDTVVVVPAAFHSPVLFTLFLLGGLVITVLMLTFVGQKFGGTGQIGDILVLIAWLQVLRLLFQLSIIAIGLVSINISALVVLAGSLWGVYILISFIDTAHGFGSLLKSFCVMVLSALAMAVILTLAMSLFGVAYMGVS